MVESELRTWNEATPVDPWAWAHEDATSEPVDTSAESVTCVLVARDAEDWVGEALRGLAAQTRRPDRIIAVDNGSADSTLTLLRDAEERGTIDAVVAGDPAWGFGHSVVQALSDDASGGGDRRWLWLLHDDAEPLPGALAAELALAAGTGAGVVFPKLLQARRRAVKQVSEMGATVSFSGARVLLQQAGDIDQGQLDSEPVLGGSSCGMLIRRDLWERLDGFDPAIALFRDGLEFGWRANLLGEAVVTCPDAEIIHRQAGRAGLRPAITDPTALDRTNGMLAVAAHRRGLGGALANLAMIIAVAVGALGYLLGKAPSRADSNIRAINGYLRGAARRRSARSRVAALDVTPEQRTRVEALRPRLSAAPAAAGRAVADAVAERWRDAFGTADDGNLDELIGDDFAGAAHEEPGPRRWRYIAPAVWTALVVLSLLAARHLLRLGHLRSLALAPAPSSWRALYHTWVDPVAGQRWSTGPAWSEWFVIGSAVLAGRPEWLVTALVVGAVAIAFIPSYLLLRTLTTDRRVHVLGAIVAGCAPALVGATARGALGAIVTAVVAPWLALALQGWRRRGTSGYESWRGAFSVGLLLTVWASFQPLVWPLALVVGALLAASTRSGAQIRRAALALAIPLVLLASWIPTLLRTPGRLLTGEDPALLGTDASPALGYLVGRSAGPGLPPLWLSILVMGSLWMLALTALWRRPRVTWRWGATAVVALALATLMGAVLVTVAGPIRVRPTVLPWLVVLVQALVASAAVGFDRVGAGLAERSFGARQIGALLAGVVALATAVLSMGWWAVGGLGSPLERTERTLPSYVAGATEAPSFGRVLTIDVRGEQPRYAVAENGTATLGGPERGGFAGGDAAAHDTARQLVADLAAGRSDATVADAVARLRLNYVVVRGANADLAASIQAVPGLQLASNDADGRVWRVTDPSRGDAVGPLPARPHRGVHWWAWLELAALVAVVVLATPSLRRSALRDPEAYARRAAGADVATPAHAPRAGATAARPHDAKEA